MSRRAVYWFGEYMSVPGVAVSKIEPAVDVRSITILGATGSIGASTVDLIKREPERYRVESISARRNAVALGKIARDVGARHAVVSDPAAYNDLKTALSGSRIEAAAGEEALIEAAQRPADWVMASISGSVGLKPTMAADRARRNSCTRKQGMPGLCGQPVHATCGKRGATVLPVDSEHNAVFQALARDIAPTCERVILTASGGPFRTWSKEAIKAATPEQPCAIPTGRWARRSRSIQRR